MEYYSAINRKRCLIYMKNSHDTVDEEFEVSFI